ncbi:MAG: hypothetical protein ACRDRT_05640 [Pseudonocardiaceae bacterium]
MRSPNCRPCCSGHLRGGQRPRNFGLVGSPSGGGFACASAASSPQITCTQATMVSGGSPSTITMSYRVTSQKISRNLTATAAVVMSTPDPAVANNAATATVSF